MTEEKPIYLTLVDVNSEHCALIIEKGLSKLNEIETHKVELNNNRVAITVKTNPVTTVQVAVKQIRSLGYNVITLTQTFPVINLSCASCAANTEAILNDQVGVVKAEVNYANTSAKVEYIPSLISAEELKKAVQASDYDLLIDDQAQSTVTEIKNQQYQSLKKNAVGAMILSIPLFVIGMFFMEMPYANFIMWALATPLLFIYGRRFFTGLETSQT